MALPDGKTAGVSDKPASALQILAKLSFAYATADVLAQAINFLLTPLYAWYLSPTDYGALALLLTLSTFLKILFRLGLDQGFLRIFYDVPVEQRKRFAGTVFVFAAGFATLMFALVWAFATPLSIGLFENATGALWVRLVAADILASSFTFVPFNLLRIERKAALLSTYSLVRHFLNTVLKVVLIVSGLGVTGVLISDAIASVALSLLLVSELRGRATPAFDGKPLWEALKFGLPKVPHGVLAQCLNLADRRILLDFVSLAQIGVYQVGNSFAGAMKFPLSAFEPAWQPFVFENAKKPNGALEIAQVATRVAILFVVVALAFALILPDALVLMIRNADYHAAAPVIPVVILGILFQGFFFLSSVGITVTKQARYYPIITGISAAVNIGLNVWLIPYYGIMASAWATVAGYALTAFIGASISKKLYPIPIEWPRIAFALILATMFFVGASFLSGGLGPAVLRVALALMFAVVTWCLIYNEADRREFKKVVGL